MSKRSRTRHDRWLLSVLAAGLLIAVAGCSDGDGDTEPPAPDTTAPDPVSSFLAMPGDGQVNVTWRNPTGGDYIGTTVRRFTTEAPAGPESGTAVYDGPAEAVLDNTVENGTAYTYAAYTYDEAGNYSDAVLSSATPHTPVVVTFPDAALEQAMRDATGIPSDPITDIDLLPLTELDLAGLAVADLTGLQYCVNLTSLDLGSTSVDDDGHLDVLAGLDSLAMLSLDYTAIIDLSFLTDITSLTALDLRETGADDLTPLASLSNLETLAFHELGVTSLEPLTGLSNLTMLQFGACDGITDFETLSGMTQLVNLRAQDVATMDLSPLSSLVNLDVLDVDGCLAHDIGGLMPLTQLSSLSIYRLPLLDEAVNVQIPALEAEGVYVGWSSVNPVETVGVWSMAGVTLNGEAADPAEFFEWAEGSTAARLSTFTNARYVYVEVDDEATELYHETGLVYIYENTIQITVYTENGVDVQDYNAFDGTWEVVGDELRLTQEDGGDTVVMTWQK